MSQVHILKLIFDDGMQGDMKTIGVFDSLEKANEIKEHIIKEYAIFKESSFEGYTFMVNDGIVNGEFTIGSFEINFCNIPVNKP